MASFETLAVKCSNDDSSRENKTSKTTGDKMTKKYRVKIHTPWTKKGEVFVYYEMAGGEFIYWASEENFLSSGVDPKKFPEIFEPIPDPVEKVAEWLAVHWKGGDSYRGVAEIIISAGLDPESLR